MPPDPPRSSALRASLLPLRGNYISHSILTKNLGIYAQGMKPTYLIYMVLLQFCFCYSEHLILIYYLSKVTPDVLFTWLRLEQWICMS